MANSLAKLRRRYQIKIFERKIIALEEFDDVNRYSGTSKRVCSAALISSFDFPNGGTFDLFSTSLQ